MDQMDPAAVDASVRRDGVTLVRRAALMTLRASGVRVLEQTFVQPSAREGLDFSTRGEGVADLAGCRADITRSMPRALSDTIVTLTRGLDEKLPWLFTDEERVAFGAGFNDVPLRAVYIGAAQFNHLADGQFHPGTGDFLDRRRRYGDPTWIIEALLWTDDMGMRVVTAKLRTWLVRGSGFMSTLNATLRSYASAETRRIGASHVLGEVWIDDSQLVRRVTWKEVPRRPGLEHRKQPASDWHRWTAIELWDFGKAVSIPMPRVARIEHSMLDELEDATRALWRRRRQYRRRRRAADLRESADSAARDHQ
jgi:hypothetical protein